MDLTLMGNLVGTVGFPIALVLILLYYIVKYINKKDTQNREDTREQIQALRDENKEDKKLFQSAIDSFNASVKSFEKVQQETISIKGDIGEIKQDLLVIKTKIDR